MTGRIDRFVRQLRSYRPPASEAAAHDAMLELVAGSSDPMARHLFDPGHFTVGAYALQDERVMLVHHRRLGIWLEPGGHIDPTDETLEQAALRELTEETGIGARLAEGGILDVDVHDIPAGKGEPAHKHFNVSFLFSATDTAVTPAAEVLDARWVPLQSVSDLTQDAAVLRVVKKLSG